MTTANVNITKVLLKRGNTVQNNNYTGVFGEITIDTQLKTLRIHDGVTAGGNAITASGAIGSYSNTNTAAYLASQSITSANIGAFQTFANANAATQTTEINSLRANITAANTLIPNLSAVSGNILPSANVTYSLGSSAYQWRDLWVSNNTIYIGNTPIRVNGNTLLVNGAPVAGSGNVSSLVNGSATFSLGSNGTLTLPGGASFVTYNETGAVDLAANVAVDSYIGLTYANRNWMYVNDTAAYIEASDGLAVKTWTFGTDGNLRLPTNGMITYANGVNILSTVTGSGTYSNANVASYLPTYTGNIAVGNIVTAVDSNLTVVTSQTLTTNNSYTNTVDFSTDVDPGVGYAIAGWYQRNSEQIEFALFGPSAFQTYLTGLALGRTVIVTYSTGSGNQTITRPLTQRFSATGQTDPANPTWGRVSGRIDATLPASQTGIVSINFPEYSVASSQWQFRDGALYWPAGDGTPTGPSIDGSSNMLVTLMQGGDFEIYTTQDITGNTRSWSFNSVGNLIVPDDATIWSDVDLRLYAEAGNIALGNQNGTWMFGNDGKLTAPGEVYGQFFTLRGGNGPGAEIGSLGYGGNLVTVHSYEGFRVETGTPESGPQWQFDTEGNLTLPNNGYLNLSGGDIWQTPDQDLAIRVRDANNDDFELRLEVDDGADNVHSRFRQRRDDIQIGLGLTGTAKYYRFRDTGDLEIPGDIDGEYGGSASLKIRGASATSFVTLKTVDNTDTLRSNVTVGIDNVVISTGTATNNWIFDNTGNLTVPGNTVVTSINAASGAGGYNVTISAGASDTVTWNSNPGGNVNITGGYGSFADGGGGNGGQVNITGGGSSDGIAGSVTVKSGTNSWKVDTNGAYIQTTSGNWQFGTGGRLSLGANIGAIYADQTTGIIRIGDSLGPQGESAAPSTVIAIGGTDNAFTISKYSDPFAQYWQFRANGETVFPQHGNVTISGNLTVGNLIVNGNSTVINTENYVVEDNIIQMANANPADTLDLGFIAHRTVDGNLQHTGLVRDASTGNWRLFSNVAAQPGNTVDFTNAVYDSLIIGGLGTTSISLTGPLNFTASPPAYSTPGIQWASGWQGDIYSNTQVATYLPTFTGNISNISFADGNLNLGGVQTPFNQAGTILNVKGIVGMTASSGANISGFSTVSVGTVKSERYQFSNGVSILDGIGGTYGNTEVAAYLPTDPTVTALQANIGSFYTYANATYTGGGGTTYTNANVVSMLAANSAVFVGNVNNVGGFSLQSNITQVFIGGNAVIASGNANVTNSTTFLHNMYFAANGTRLVRNTGAGVGLLSFDPTGFTVSGLVTVQTANTIPALPHWIKANTSGLFAPSGFTTSTMTASGTVAANGTNGIQTSQTTFPLVNQTATTILFGGAATTISMGSSTIGGVGSNVFVGNAIGTSTGNLTLRAFGTYNSVNSLTSSGGYGIATYTNIAVTGGSGTGMIISMTGVASGYLGSATVTNPGTGYRNGDTITIPAGNPSGSLGGSFVLGNYNAGFSGTGNGLANYTFGIDGNLTLPGNLSLPNAARITYANGANVLYGNTQADAFLSSGPVSNITMATGANISGVGNIIGSTANTTITSGAYTSSFLSNGMVAIGGNLTVSGNNNNVVTKASFIGATGTATTLDNISANWNGGPAQFQIATVSGSILAHWNIQTSFNGTFTVSSNNGTLTTSPTNLGGTAGTAGDAITVMLTDITNGRFYRITGHIGPSYLNSPVIIERVV